MTIRIKNTSQYSHSRIRTQLDNERPKQTTIDVNTLLSPKSTPRLVKLLIETVQEQCHVQKCQKLSLPLFLSFFLFFSMYIMNTTTESYGPQTLSKLIQKQNLQKVFYFQSQTRPRESIKLLSEAFLEEYYATFLNKEDKLVIVAIVSSIQSDVDKLCIALRSLVFLKGDIAGYPSPVLIFQEGNLPSHQYEQIVLSTSRPIAFPVVDFQSFPKSFNVKKYTSNTNSSTAEEDLGYKQMLRFWISGIWKHVAIQPFDIIMRIDSDSCFKEVNTHLPNFVHNEHNRIKFHSQYVGREPITKYVKELYPFAVKYIAEEKIIPSNTLLWHFITDTRTQYETIPVFMTHNSILRKSLFQSPQIQKWHEAITDSEPFGVYHYRWADSAVFFLTIAMFLGDEFIMTNRMDGYYHREGCKKSDVDLSIEMFTEKRKWSSQ